MTEAPGLMQLRLASENGLSLRIVMPALVALVTPSCGGLDEGGDASGSVGSPCEPAFGPSDGSASKDEVNVVLRYADCEAMACVVEAFQGRSDCPYGRAADDQAVADCAAIGHVPAQLLSRPPKEAMFCSCRCDGPAGYEYCACPKAMFCTELVPDLAGMDDDWYAGSYCTKLPPGFDPEALSEETCDRSLMNCEDR